MNISTLGVTLREKFLLLSGKDESFLIEISVIAKMERQTWL